MAFRVLLHDVLSGHASASCIVVTVLHLLSDAPFCCLTPSDYSDHVHFAEHPHDAATTSTTPQLEGEQEFDEEVEEEGQGNEERPSTRKRKRTKGPGA